MSNNIQGNIKYVLWKLYVPNRELERGWENIQCATYEHSALRLTSHGYRIFQRLIKND